MEGDEGTWPTGQLVLGLAKACQFVRPAYSIDSTEPQVAETSGQNPRVFGHENDRKHNLEAQVESLEYPDQTKSNQTKSNLKGKSVNE